MLTLIEGGDVFTPEPGGPQSVLIVAGEIAKVGTIDRRAVEGSGLPVEVIDASGCVVIPGLLDPHEHLIGGSGERGFASQTPEVMLTELIEGGITTVVGCLGVDTTTRTMGALVAKAKGLNEEGLSAYVYAGGYNVPPTTLTGSIRGDLLFVAEVIGAGEIAISDARSTEPTVAELARLVRDASVGGLLSGKAGVTHFHVGDLAARLRPVRALLDDYAVDPALLYPTHVERTEALMGEAVELTHRGVTVDVDVVERDLPHWLRFFIDHGGNLGRLTVSSDAAINSPGALLEQLRSCVIDHGLALATVLPLVTTNTARVLKLPLKGRLEPGCDGDVLVLRRDGLELVTVVARGRTLLRDGRLLRPAASLRGSNRRMSWHGENTTSQN